MATKFFVLLIFQLIVIVNLVNGTANIKLDLEVNNPAFDPQFYEDLLDSEVCQQQLNHIRNISNVLLRFQFLEAGIRFPRGLLEGNFVDMGNYYQCLGISEEIEDSTIEGKYCIVQGPAVNSLGILAENMNWTEYDPDVFSSEELINTYQKYEKGKSKIHITKKEGASRADTVLPLLGASFRLAVCVPKACTVQEGIEGLHLLNFTVLGLRFDEEFCRVNNDKPWVPADYIAIVVFSLIGLLTILSTGYDIWYTLVAKNDPKSASKLYRSFSVYTNAQRLTTFSSNPNNLDCIDGIRMLSMLWVIVGHTYSTLPPVINMLYAYTDWLFAFKSTWITSANFAVDTFFTLTGILTVYTTAGKLSGMKLLKNLHLFYLNRLLRMFPLLAAIILLQSSVLHRVADGPLWTDTVVPNTELCRTYWWSTLLYIQNIVNPGTQCIAHGWYLAIDIHLHILSPLVLFWVLSGKRNQAWIGLTGGLLVSLTIAAVYCFVNQFPGWSLAPSRGEQTAVEYFYDYYFNTLPRAPPFFVGMVFGYLLHIWRGQKTELHPAIVLLLWFLTVFSTASLMYITYLMKDWGNWDYPLADDFMNTFARSVWAMAVGWVVFACKHGMGGPVNWFLSLNLWKLPSRVSYGMYLFSYPIQFVLAGRAVAPVYFSDGYVLYEFMSQILLTFGVAFFATLLIDSPFSILFKLMLGDGPKKPRKEESSKQ